MSKLYHLSRMAAPGTWPVKRKGIKWIAKPLPGPHSTYYSMTLGTWLQEILGLAKTKRDIKRILIQGDVLVNSRAIKELNFPVGLFDVLSLSKLKKNYRVLLNSIGKLILTEVSDADAKLVPAKIISKTTSKAGKLQINCNNGWNFISGKDEYKIGDVLFFDSTQRKLVKHVKLAKGAIAFVIGGSHVGSVAKLDTIKESGKLRKQKIAVLSVDKETWETNLEQVFVIGEKSPEIKVT